MRTAILLAAAAALLLLPGCASTDPRPLELPKEVRIPVPVPCIKDPIARPALVTDAQLAAMGDGDLVLSLAADRRERQQYEGKLEAQLAGCR
jgi:type IV pilus biogenesis protein CpaD/CtpE